jgi:hypothetical protein
MLTSLKRKTERNVGEYMLDETWRPGFMLAETLKHDSLSSGAALQGSSSALVLHVVRPAEAIPRATVTEMRSSAGRPVST